MLSAARAGEWRGACAASRASLPPISSPRPAVVDHDDRLTCDVRCRDERGPGAKLPKPPMTKPRTESFTSSRY